MLTCLMLILLINSISYVIYPSHVLFIKMNATIEKMTCMLYYNLFGSFFITLSYCANSTSYMRASVMHAQSAILTLLSSAPQ